MGISPPPFEPEDPALAFCPALANFLAWSKADEFCEDELDEYWLLPAWAELFAPFELEFELELVLDWALAFPSDRV